MEKIDFVMGLLHDLEAELREKHLNVQREVEKKTEELVSEVLKQKRDV